jgi:uncharacterized protein (TIGR02271 family)
MEQDDRLKQRQAADRAREPAQRSTDEERTVKSKTIPVIEEQVQVGKKVVETGQVSINKRVSQEDVIVDVPYVQEEINVERVPMNRYIDTPPPAMRQEGDTTIIPVLKEVVVKRLVLVEELHITKKKVQQQASQDMTLRREEVEIQRKNSDSHNQSNA